MEIKLKEIQEILKESIDETRDDITIVTAELRESSARTSKYEYLRGYLKSSKEKMRILKLIKTLLEVENDK